MSEGKGSTGNVIAAIASLVFPGLGQLVQGRIIAALFFFVLAGAIHFFTLGMCSESSLWPVSMRQSIGGAERSEDCQNPNGNEPRGSNPGARFLTWLMETEEPTVSQCRNS